MPARFLVSPELLSGTQAVLTGSELHHLHVRRLRIGSELILGDGRGGQRRGTVVALSRQEAVIHLHPIAAPELESPLHLVLAQATLKADKMDLVIEKAIELGVSEILVFTSERSLGQPSADRQARWQRVARSAIKQCQRSVVPAIGAVVSFDCVLSRPEVLRLLFSHDARLGLTDVNGRYQSVLAAVGPEGGFSSDEVQRASAHGFRHLGLGPRTLRAETAALAVVALCQFLWGDLKAV